MSHVDADLAPVRILNPLTCIIVLLSWCSCGMTVRLGWGFILGNGITTCDLHVITVVFTRHVQTERIIGAHFTKLNVVLFHLKSILEGLFQSLHQCLTVAIVPHTLLRRNWHAYDSWHFSFPLSLSLSRHQAHHISQMISLLLKSIVLLYVFSLSLEMKTPSTIILQVLSVWNVQAFRVKERRETSKGHRSILV